MPQQRQTSKEVVFSHYRTEQDRCSKCDFLKSFLIKRSTSRSDPDTLYTGLYSFREFI